MTSRSGEARDVSIVRDSQWFAHRYVEQDDAVQFMKLSREDHDRATFIVDEYLPVGRDRVQLPRREAVQAARPQAVPIHFIFHSAFCCSTLLARALDLPGCSTSLKEPTILNDVVGCRRRGFAGRQVAEILDGALTLLARPLGSDAAVVVKPSNIINGLARVMLAMRPEAGAVLLYAPLATFITSVAKKGLNGRLWVRELFIGFRKDGLVQRLGFDDEQFFGQSDLQIAAAGWLAQQAVFADLQREFGSRRVRCLDSESLLRAPAETLKQLATLYDLPIDDALAKQIADGPVFRRDAKSGTPFTPADRDAEYRSAGEAHSDEIEKVVHWAKIVAQEAGIPLQLSGPPRI